MNIFQAADTTVNGPRQDDYGHPLDDFAKTAHIWTGVLLPKLLPGATITPEDVALCMIGVKMSREVHKPAFDNRLDGIGYWATLQMIHEERARREGEG